MLNTDKKKNNDYNDYIKLYGLTEDNNELIKLIETISDTEEYKITENDLYVIVKCIKCYVEDKCFQYEKLNNYSIKEIFNKTISEKKKFYKESVENCINIIKNFLRKKDQLFVLAKIGFNKLLGDLYDKLNTLSNNNEYLLLAKGCYIDVYNIININLIDAPVTNILVSTFYLNYSVFLVNKACNLKKGIYIAKSFLNKVAYGGLGGKNNKVSNEFLFISQIIKDNYTLWTIKFQNEESKFNLNIK